MKDDFLRKAHEKYVTTAYGKVNSPAPKALEYWCKSYHSIYSRRIPAKKDIAILDIGCGMGQLLHYLQTEGYTNLTGIDISPEQIELCKQILPQPRPRLVAIDAFTFLPKSSSAYDLIFMNDVIEHIPLENLCNFLSLCGRALKPDGKIIIRTNDMSNPLNLRSRYQTITHLIGFTEESMSELLEINNYRVEAIIHEYPYLPGKVGVLRTSMTKALSAVLNLLLKGLGLPKARLSYSLIVIAAKA
ncbi:MAG: class I SAM-dependent methyltransferase [Thermodesulfobacteriota bacterium]